MMNAETPDKNRENPNEELDARLGEAVRSILDNGPPEELMNDSLDRLRQQRPPAVRPRTSAARRLTAVVALAAAASIMGLMLWRQFHDGDPGQPEIAENRVPTHDVPTKNATSHNPTPNEAPSADVPASGVDQPPTIWVYHRAARQSPEALDALLDDHADRLALSSASSSPFGLTIDYREETLWCFVTG